MHERERAMQSGEDSAVLVVCVRFFKTFFFFKNTDWAKWTVSLFYSYLTPFYFLDILLTHWVCESKRNLSMSVFLCVGSCVCGQILISKGWTLVNSVRSVPSLVWMYVWSDAVFCTLQFNYKISIRVKKLHVLLLVISLCIAY